MKNQKRHGVLLGLLVVAVFGVLAFATSAQAAIPQFVYKNGLGTEISVLLASIVANQLGRGTLSIPALNAEINCEKFSIVSGEINTATDASGELLYEECTALEESAPLGELTGCLIVVNHTGDNRHHITAKALILPAELTDGSYAVLAEKIEATVLTIEGEGCLLPKTTKIKGELCLKVDNNESVEPELLASTEIQGLCKERTSLEALSEGGGVKDKLLFGAQEAFVTGKADVHLTGEHNGYSLGVLLKP